MKLTVIHKDDQNFSTPVFECKAKLTSRTRWHKSWRCTTCKKCLAKRKKKWVNQK